MEKIKVCFYHPDKTFPDVDCTHLGKGNPGVGGSDYALLLVAEKLAITSDKLSVFVATQSNNPRIPVANGKLHRLYAKDQSVLLKEIIDNGISVIVFRYGIICTDDEFFVKIQGKAKVVIWCHNTVPLDDLNKFCKIDSVGRLISVTKEQMDLYIDHNAYKISDYIYNALPEELISDSRKSIVPYLDRPKNVVYMGSLVPAKTFHILAKAWPEVLKKVPEAQLYVIGSGQLYSREQSLGKYGIAEASYENSFMQYLTNDKGDILESVHFMGVLGSEKNDVMRNARVAVPNPRGDTETFCICAIEMQLAGCLLTTISMSAYLDTVNPQFSILYNNTNKLAESIIKLLNYNVNHNIDDEIDFVDYKFNLNNIITEWERLFTTCLWDGSHIHPFKLTHPNYKLKWLRNINRTIRDIVPGGNVYLPSSNSVFRFAKKIFNLFHKL